MVDRLIDLFVRAGLEYDRAKTLAMRISVRVRKARGWTQAAARGKVTNGQRNAAGARLANILRDMLRDAGFNGVVVTFQPNQARLIRIEHASLRNGGIELGDTD